MREPHRAPFRPRAPVGRRDTDVTRPDLVPSAQQKATLMNTAKKLSTAALEADRKLTVMAADEPRSRITRSEKPSDRDALGEVGPGRYCSLRHGMLFSFKKRMFDVRYMTGRSIYARPYGEEEPNRYRRRATDVTNRQLAAANDDFGGSLGEPRSSTDHNRKATDQWLREQDMPRVGAGVAVCLGGTETEKIRPGKGRGRIEAAVAKAAGGASGGHDRQVGPAGFCLPRHPSN